MDNLELNHETLWNEIKEGLLAELPKHAYNTWFEPIAPIALSDSELVLEVPNQFFFEWIESHYHNKIESAVKDAVKNGLSVKYTIAPWLTPKDRQSTEKSNRKTEAISLRNSTDRY